MWVCITPRSQRNIFPQVPPAQGDVYSLEEIGKNPQKTQGMLLATPPKNFPMTTMNTTEGHMNVGQGASVRRTF